MEIKAATARIAKLSMNQPVTLLVGAGLSMNPPVSLPGWGELMKRAAEIVREYHPPYAGAMLSEIEAGAFIDAADYFSRRNVVPRARRAEFFREQFGNRPAPNNLPDVYKLLAKVPVHIFATTNYDPCLEIACAEIGPALDNDDASIKSFIDAFPKSRQVIYLHGRAIKYDTIVFDRESYKAREQSELYMESLKRIFTTTCVIAVGYSASDPDLALIARFIGEDLGGAGAAEHFILMDHTPENHDLLRRANWTVVRYPEGKHEELKAFLRDLIGKLEAPSLTYLQRTGSRSLRTLALAFLKSTVADSSAASFETACQVILLRAIGSNKVRRQTVFANAASLLAVSTRKAKELLSPVLATLLQSGKVSETDSGAYVATEILSGDEFPESAHLEGAIIKRARTFYASFGDSPSIRAGIRRVVAEVMFTEGMALARSFSWTDDPGAYDLDAIVADAVGSASSIPSELLDPLRRALREILIAPDAASSRELHRLATAAYLMERIMLHPKEPNLGEAMQWRIYFDSNVIMRLISPFDRRRQPFTKLVDKFRQLQVPLLVLYPFVAEVVQHGKTVAREVRSVREIRDLRKLVEGQAEAERSPILTWYFGEVQRQGRLMGFSEFAQKSKINTAASLSRKLQSLGFKIEGKDATRQMDTSQRETLWDHLRKARRVGDTVLARGLRRNEATQVEWLVALRQKGIRAWFLSIDSELRRALQLTDYARDRDYTGYVMSPAAWAMKLNELQWGLLGIEGFVEMMWSLPERSSNDKVTDAALVRLTEELLKKEVLVSPDALRDAVEQKVIALSGVMSALGGADDQEAVLDELVEQVVVPTASEMLEKLGAAKKQKKTPG